jgi:ProP effector
VFGPRAVPLKVGIFDELRAAHPEQLPAETLKAALGDHTRSTRYLEAVASGLPRHGLDGQPVEPVAPEHVHHAILELHRRKGGSPQARERALKQLVENIERSGLGRDGYRERFGQHPASQALVDEALSFLAHKAARHEALSRAFQASGKSREEFAEMYGLSPAEVATLA